ncbi:unnamed protein product, partial [Musa textilis]
SSPLVLVSVEFFFCCGQSILVWAHRSRICSIPSSREHIRSAELFCECQFGIGLGG